MICDFAIIGILDCYVIGCFFSEDNPYDFVEKRLKNAVQGLQTIHDDIRAARFYQTTFFVTFINGE